MHDLTLETVVLARLLVRVAPAPPSYDDIDSVGRVAGYPLLTGSPLTPARLRRPSAVAHDERLAEAVEFLPALHAIPPEIIVADGRRPQTWAAAQLAERGLADPPPVTALPMPAIADPLHACSRDRAGTSAAVASNAC